MGYRGRVEKGVVVLDRPIPWPNGTKVTIEVLPPEESTKGSTPDPVESQDRHLREKPKR